MKSLPEAGMQLPLAVRLRDEATFDNFHGRHNSRVLDRLRAALAQAQPLIVLAGDTGSGKSHLLQAASQAEEEAGRTVHCVDLQELQVMAPEVLEGLDSADLVCLDNLHLVCGRQAWEEALFHLVNRLHDRNAILLVSSAKVPAELPMVLADLGSRLAAGILIQLARPRDEDRLAILQARAERRGLELSDEVAQYILRRADRHTEALLAVLQVLDDASLSSQRRLTIPFIKSVMGW